MIDFRAGGQELLPGLKELRRDLHAHPEVGLDLPRTQEKVLAALEGLPLEVTTGVETTSVVAVLRGTGEGRPAEGAPAVLLRGDMDALSIEAWCVQAVRCARWRESVTDTIAGWLRV